MKTNKKQVLINRTFVHQHSQLSCEPACLISILKFYIGETRNKLRKNSGTFLNGTSLLVFTRQNKNWVLRWPLPKPEAIIAEMNLNH